MILSRNKKGMSLFFPGMVLIVLVTIVLLSFTLSNKMDSKTYTLGKVQSSILNLYDSAGDEQYYVDIGAIQAQRDSFYEMVKHGGGLNYDCGKYLGYNLLVNQKGICYSIKNDDKIEELINLNLQPMTDLKRDLSLNFNIDIQNNVITGTNMNPLRRDILISQDEDESVSDKYLKEKTEESKEINEYINKNPELKINDRNQLGTFNITMYYTAYEGDFDTYSTTKKDLTSSTQACKIYNKGFYESVRCQGSGLTRDGRICYYTFLNSDEKSKDNCLKVNDDTKSVSFKLDNGKTANIYSRGVTATGTNPTTHRTIAVDKDYIGKTFYLFFENGPSVWDGCYKGEDRGSMINKNHFDIYVGIGEKDLKKASLPERATVFEGCELS